MKKFRYWAFLFLSSFFVSFFLTSCTNPYPSVYPTPNNGGPYPQSYIPEGTDVSALIPINPSAIPGYQPTPPVVQPSSPVNPTTSPLPGGTLSEWTVMVYVDGDNDLSSYAFQDINTMEFVGSTDQVKIVAQLDSLGITGTKRYLIMPDSNPFMITSPVIGDPGEVNMGNGSSLTGFIQFSVQKYPAKKYALVLWNHGGGFRSAGETHILKDICWDESSGNDSLTMPELSQALSSSGVFLNVLAMDACLMGMVEVAYQVRNNASILVASEESVPGEGMVYERFLQDLVSSPTMEGSTLARYMIDSYMNIYSGSGMGVTLSSLRLSSLSPLITALDQLAGAILSDSGSRDLYREIGCRDTIWFSDTDFIDIGNFAQNLINHPSVSGTVKATAQNVLSGLGSAVLYNRGSGLNDYNWNLSGVRGLSIYFPYNPYSAKYNELAFAQSTQWDNLAKFIGSGTGKDRASQLRSTSPHAIDE